MSSIAMVGIPHAQCGTGHGILIKTAVGDTYRGTVMPYTSAERRLGVEYATPDGSRVTLESDLVLPNWRFCWLGGEILSRYLLSLRSDDDGTDTVNDLAHELFNRVMMPVRNYSKIAVKALQNDFGMNEHEFAVILESLDTMHPSAADSIQMLYGLPNKEQTKGYAHELRSWAQAGHIQFDRELVKCLRRVGFPDAVSWFTR